MNDAYEVIPARPSLLLVRGYLPRLDELPRAARRYGLRSRFAVAVWDGEDPEAELEPDLLTLFSDAVGADEHRIWDTGGNSFTTPQAFAASQRDLSEGDREDVDQAWFVRGGVRVGYVCSTYVMGGVTPYVDSCTYELFTRATVHDELAASVRAAGPLCKIDERVGGDAPDLPWWRYRFFAGYRVRW